MADLASPPIALMPAGAEPFAWPTPELPNYPPPTPHSVPLACQLEGNNGKIINGRMLVMDTVRGTLQFSVPGGRAPLTLRFDQFRRVRLLDPLSAAAPEYGGTVLNDLASPAVPFSVAFVDDSHWQGHTIGHREDAIGLFLFEPVDNEGTVRRTFVPRTAYSSVEIGRRVGELLVEQDSIRPDQLSAALHEQQALRERRLGDLLVVQKIISPEELDTAIDQQTRMPMVRIGEALLALQYITEQQLNEALAQQQRDRGVPLGELLVRKGAVSRTDLQTALARKMGYPLVDVSQFPIDSEAVARLPYAVAQRAHALPLLQRGSRLVVAMEDPTSRAALEEVEFAARCKVLPVLAQSGPLLEALTKAYEKLGAVPESADSQFEVEYEAVDVGKLAASMDGPDGRSNEDEGPAIEQSDNSLVRLINSMILEAHSQGVSDIHVECPPGKQKVRIRFRKDGVLRPYLELPPSYRNALVARLKIMCDLDISERRKPQDGKINFSKYVQGSRLELRVATIPTTGGAEDAVLRLLASSRAIPLAQLHL